MKHEQTKEQIYHRIKVCRLVAETVNVEQAVYAWMVQQRARNNMLTGDYIAEKTRFFPGKLWVMIACEQVTVAMQF